MKQHICVYTIYNVEPMVHKENREDEGERQEKTDSSVA